MASLLRWGAPLLSIASNVKHARKLAGLDQVELASRAGISRGGVQWAENPQHEPKIETLRKIASALQTPLAVLLGDDATSPEAYRIGAMAERLRPEDRETVVGLIQRLEVAA